MITYLVLSRLNSQDIVSEHPERFFISEIVREKIFMQYRKEVPYACQVYYWKHYVWLVMHTIPQYQKNKNKQKKSIDFSSSRFFSF
jgi:hypothetical protein